MSLKDADIALTNFSNSLIPTDDFVAEGKALIEKVFNVLKHKTKEENEDKSKIKFLVDRIFYGGSVGKHTSVVCPDFDCTIFLNKEPPFTQVLEHFVQIIKAEYKFLEIHFESIRATHYSVRFTFESGFLMDLLPAANFVKQESGIRGAELAEAQRQQVIQRLHKDPTKYYFFSSSLSESQLEFMKKQDTFTHQLVRLCKFWYKTVYMKEYVSGGSTIVELLAVYAAQKHQEDLQEQDEKNKSMMTVFISFLKTVSNLDTLKLAFELKDGHWKYATDPQTLRQIIPLELEEFLNRPYFIIEPANPFNDMAETLTPSVIKKLKEFAEITIMRFKNGAVAHCIIREIEGKPYFQLDNLFRPLPINLLSLFEVKPTPYYFCTVDNQCLLKNACKKIISNARIYERKEILELIDAIRIFIFATVHSFVRSSPRIEPEEVKDRVLRMFHEDVMGVDAVRRDQSAFDEDITLIVPFESSSFKSSAIQLTIKWILD